VNVTLISNLLHSVKQLQPVAQAYDRGDVAVLEHPLGNNVQALYLATPGTFEPAPELTDTIVLGQQRPWDLENSIYQQSIIVHEAYHCLDDLQPSSDSTGHLASEARAWTGQAQYLAERLSSSSQPGEATEALLTEMRESGMGDLECFALLLAVKAAPLPMAAQPAAELLASQLRSSLTSLQGVDGMLEKPAESLPQALSLIYWTTPETKVATDGVSRKRVGSEISLRGAESRRL
jgi:hypothetical protein